VDWESGLESVSDQEILTFCGNYWEAEDPFSPLFASWQTRRAFSTLRYAASRKQKDQRKFFNFPLFPPAFSDWPDCDVIRG
jgi:hypothetical protein